MKPCHSSFLLIAAALLGTGSGASSDNDDVLAWWEKMDVLKPVQCRSAAQPPETSSEGGDPVESHPCEGGADPPRYRFKGKKSNGRLDGPGRLRTANMLPMDDDEVKRLVEDNVCYSLPNVAGKPIVEIVGSFANGSLQGLAKLTYKDGSVTIGSFDRGLLHGLGREFNSTGSLQSVGYYANGVKSGRFWTRAGQDLLVLNDDHHPSLIVRLADGRAFAGTWRRHLRFYEDVRAVENLKRTSDDGDCLLAADYETGGAEQDFHFVLVTNVTKTVSPRALREERTMCGDIRKLDDESQDLVGNELSETLLRWFWSLEPIDSPPSGDPLPLLSELTVDPSGANGTARIMNGSEPVAVELVGCATNDRNEIHGECLVNVAGDVPEDPALFWKLTSIRGRFANGRLNGAALLGSTASHLNLVTARDGVLHGPVVTYGVQPFFPDAEPFLRKVEREKAGGRTARQLGYVGHYRNGRAWGTFWKGLLGKGYLHGSVDARTGTISGNAVSYIYRDMETAFFGTFENRLMVDARHAAVAGFGCDEEQGIAKATGFDVVDPDTRFYYEAPAVDSFGAGPEGVRDPWERKMVTLRNSTIPGSGEGVFVNVDVEKGTAAALYNGFMLRTPGEVDEYEERNRKRGKEYLVMSHKYNLGITFFDVLRFVTSIPPELDGPGSFHPTLGQKINHSFDGGNCFFSSFDHPRWGLISSMMTSKALKAGDELFTEYGYGVGPHSIEFFPWYADLYNRIKKEERLKAEQEGKAKKTQKAKEL